jgi:hypothetical protein
MLTRPWLAQVPWDLVRFQNASLCAAKNAVHKPNSEGYEVTRDLWESRHQESMSLMKAVDFCRQCHRMAPFCFFNGNTFAAIARNLIGNLVLGAPEAAAARSMVGHIVAGVASSEEIEAFRKFCGERSGPPSDR